MLRRHSWLPCALAALLLLAPLPAPARADATDEPLAEDSLLGGLAAVGCGIMVRATIATAGTQVGTIAGAIACCGYMLFDAYLEAHKPK